MSGKLPAFLFYPGDWMKDPSLRSCSLEARGFWVDMLCLMFESPVRGELRHANGKPITAQQLARICGADILLIQNLTTELSEAGVFSQAEDGAILSRRMVRDENIRKVRAEAGKKGGNPVLLKQNRTTQDKQIPTPSSSSSSSISSSEVKSSICPETPKPASSGPEAATSEGVLNFPCDGKAKQWALTQEQVGEWAALFPSLDILAECRAALAWVLADSKRRKTANGMPKFLVGWFGRSQDKGKPNHTTNGATNGRSTAEERRIAQRNSPGVVYSPDHPGFQWNA